MAIEAETKDCTALTDAELGEMGDICAGGPARFEFGFLSKAREEWVLITLARHEGKLHGFSFCTLERIGGTPCVLIGLASVKRTAKRDQVLKAMMTDQYRRALMAFPDEDVLIGTRFAGPAGFEAFKNLTDVVPRPGHKAVGEERAWGRRLVKRFSIEGTYDENTFLVKGTGAVAGVLDHDTLKPEAIDAGIAGLFKGIKPSRGDCLVACGWAMAEDLAKLGR
ncbi:MAG: hypothetical protein AB7L13_06725 [Acidimicrobiia bacterium]